MLTGRYATMDRGVYNGAPSSVAELTAEQWQRVEDMLVKLEAEHPRGEGKESKEERLPARHWSSLSPQEEVGGNQFVTAPRQDGGYSLP